MTDRAEYTAGLRQLAQILDTNPDLPIPYDGSASPMLIMFFTSEADANRAGMASAATAIGGRWNKEVRDQYFDLTSSLRGLKLKLCAYREEVCTKVVTGTREVTEQVPDPNALAAVPMIEVTKTVEDIEWQCGSLLAPVPGLAEHTAAACDTIQAAAPLTGRIGSGLVADDDEESLIFADESE